jgi:PIN domain nuclease of toxin-antitoxin system
MGSAKVILLDTHVLVWTLENSAELGKKAKKTLTVSGDHTAVSAISFWEIAMLATRGRLTISSDISEWRRQILALGINEVPIDGSIGIAACQLKDFHPDPADRFIVATAIRRGIPLITADERILAWQGGLSVLDARR